MPSFEKVSSAVAKKDLEETTMIANGVFDYYPDMPVEIRKSMMASRQKAVSTFDWRQDIAQQATKLVARISPSGDGSVELMEYKVGRFTDCLRAVKKMQDMYANNPTLAPSLLFTQVRNKNPLKGAPVPSKISVTRPDGVTEWYKNPKYKEGADQTPAEKPKTLISEYIDFAGGQKALFDTVKNTASESVYTQV